MGKIVNNSLTDSASAAARKNRAAIKGRVAKNYKNSETVGDVNSSAKGSGARYNAGKPNLSLIPMFTLEDEARVWEYGAKKYAAWNWVKGQAWSIPLACALRHLSAWQKGEELDPESGLPHLAHASCNLRMLTLYSRTYQEGDDRPPQEFMNDTK